MRFTWGTTASAVGAEGAAPMADWKGWESDGRAPDSSDGNGFATRYAEDFALLAEHGVTSHRLTLEWARLEPREHHRDSVAVTHYLDVLRAAQRAGVEVWATLHHVSLPGWFSEDNRGFLDDRMATRVWPAHVDWVAETFGHLVAGWLPMHEPSTYAALAFGEGIIPPGRRSEDDQYQGLRALLAANRQAAVLLRGDTPVISAHPSTFDRFDELRDDLEAFTAIGITHGADHDGNLLGALHELVERLDGDAGPVVVATCGLATEDEEARQVQLLASVDQVLEARHDGIDVSGFWWRTAIDGYEWLDGFGPRWGLFDRDRNPRPALAAYVERLAPLDPGPADVVDDERPER